MDYKEQARDAKIIAESFRQDGNVILPNRLEMHATAITDLLARAEAAEARAEKAERERGEAVNLCGKLIALCSPPNEWKLKLFRPYIKRIGDYMGSGYPFLDSFNHIFDEFTETADEETYRAIREAAEAAMKGEQDG